MAAAAACVLLAFPGGTAHSQPDYPPLGPECIRLNASTFVIGDPIVVFTGLLGPGILCFDPGTLVTGTLESDPVVLGRTSANADGGYRIESRIPAGTVPGPHTVRASGTLNGQPTSYTQRITVLGEVTAAGQPLLPATGRDLVLIALWGAGLTLLGWFLIGVTWRRWRFARVEAEALREQKDADPVAFLDPDDQRLAWLRPGSRRRSTAHAVDTAPPRGAFSRLASRFRQP